MDKIKLLLYGEIGWEVQSKEVVTYLDEHKGDEIEMHVNSPGGDVFEAIAIRSAVLAHPNLSIVVDSMAASAAAIISLCGKPLAMAEYSRLMLHSASSYASGNAKEMEKQLAMLRSIDEDLASMIAGKMGKGKDEVLEEYFDGKDHWLTAEEVVGMGIASMVEKPKADDLSAKSFFDCVNGERHGNHIKKSYSDMDITKIQSVVAFKDCNTEDEVVETAKAQEALIADKTAEIEERDAKIAELEAKVAEYENEKAQAQAEADEKAISDAVEEGRMTEEQAGICRNLIKSDRENALKMISSMTTPAGQAKVSDFIKGDGVKADRKSYFQEEMDRIANSK